MDRKVAIEPRRRDAIHAEIVAAINALGEQTHEQGIRLREDREILEKQCRNLEEGSVKFDRIEAQLVEIKKLTEVIVDAKAVGLLALKAGRALKWAGGVAAAIVAFFVLWREAAASLFHEVAK